MQSLTQSPRHGLLIASIAAIGLTILTLLLLPQTVRGIFSEQFLPHVYCYLYDKKLIALHIGSDTAIWLSYVSISITLAYLVHRTRHEIPFSWMFLAFGTFIIACGFTHFMEVVVLWKPLYWLSGDVKLLTALASVITAVALPPLVPKIHGMLTAAKLSERHRSDLETANAQLSRVNLELQTEMEERLAAQTELRTLSGRLLGLQDEERRRLARELHDSTGQLLAALRLNLDLLRSRPGSEKALAAPTLDDTAALTDQIIAEVRTMSYLLHPPMLDEAGLLRALQWYAEGFTERSRIQVTLDLPSALKRLPRDVETAMFRIVQECLTNIHRHSEATSASIRLQADHNNLVLVISDNGKGMKQPQASDQGNGSSAGLGVGIRGMRERARQLKGSIEFAAGNPGTEVRVCLPLAFEAATA